MLVWGKKQSLNPTFVQTAPSTAPASYGDGVHVSSKEVQSSAFYGNRGFKYIIPGRLWTSVGSQIIFDEATNSWITGKYITF